MKVDSKIEQDLRKRKIRPTAMRILVLRYLIEESQCTSLVELEQYFDKADPSTLFRTLTREMLAETDLPEAISPKRGFVV